MPNRQHILIIEDEKKWQAILEETLDDEGYDITLVANYQHGRQALEKLAFDLVILDLNLDESAPMLDGERLLRRISRRHASIPCIIVSGQGDVNVVRNAFKQYHVVDFIAKDQFDISTFIQVVEDALKQNPFGASQDQSRATTAAAPPQQMSDASDWIVDDGWGKKAPEQRHLNKLLQILVERFDEDELRTLCFHLGIDYAVLPREGQVNKARELIMRLKRRERIFELVQAGKRLRSDIPWDDLP